MHHSCDRYEAAEDDFGLTCPGHSLPTHQHRRDAQHFRDRPGLSSAALLIPGLITVINLCDLSQAAATTHVRQELREGPCDLVPGLLRKALSPQQSFAIWADEPRPYGTVVVCRISLHHVSFEPTSIRAIFCRQGAHPDRSQQVLPAHIHHSTLVTSFERSMPKVGGEKLVGPDLGNRNPLACNSTAVRLQAVVQAQTVGPHKGVVEGLRRPIRLPTKFSGQGRIVELDEVCQRSQAVAPQGVDLNTLPVARREGDAVPQRVHPSQLGVRIACLHEAIRRVHTDPEASACLVALDNFASRSKQWSVNGQSLTGGLGIGANRFQVPE
mmetsp:Transcript_74452/g.240803  ORF Transcript_74452/g.240803 Transcript_74452/m.240803 type:complete len:326 (+) Transcript_74452:478-1455(+)